MIQTALVNPLTADCTASGESNCMVYMQARFAYSTISLLHIIVLLHFGFLILLGDQWTKYGKLILHLLIRFEFHIYPVLMTLSSMLVMCFVSHHRVLQEKARKDARNEWQKGKPRCFLHPCSNLFSLWTTTTVFSLAPCVCVSQSGSFVLTDGERESERERQTEREGRERGLLG